MSNVVIVTGGSRGIGAAVAQMAGRSGYSVCVNYAADAAAAEGVADNIRAAGSRAITFKADVADEAAVTDMFERTAQELGSVSALVNNAGVLDTHSKVQDMPLARVRRVFEVNVLGTFLCARAAANVMSTDNGGAGGVIVNLSSAAARLGAAGEYVDYAASKAAIDTFTLGFAREVAHCGIRVNAVRPGLIETEIHASGGDPDRVARLTDVIPIKRGGTAEEVAECVLWLMSDAASYVLGSVVDVAGGR